MGYNRNRRNNFNGFYDGFGYSWIIIAILVILFLAFIFWWGAYGGYNGGYGWS